MRKTGLGLAEPQRAHPRLSLIEIIGHDGNRAETPGHDLNYQAAQGTLSPPAMPLVPLADVLGAERAVSTALAAVVARAGSGAGGAYRVVLEVGRSLRCRRRPVRPDLSWRATRRCISRIRHLRHLRRLRRAGRHRAPSLAAHDRCLGR